MVTQRYSHLKYTAHISGDNDGIKAPVCWYIWVCFLEMHALLLQIDIFIYLTFTNGKSTEEHQKHNVTLFELMDV